MNGDWINLRQCDIKQAKNLSINHTPIVKQCYRISNPDVYQTDENQYSFYQDIRRGDIVYRPPTCPYFSPLFQDPAALVYLETSPQLVTRLAKKHALYPSPVGNIRQVDDETTSRYVIFADVFDQLNRNTFLV